MGGEQRRRYSYVYSYTCVSIYPFVSHLLTKRKTKHNWNLVHIFSYSLFKNSSLFFFDPRGASLKKLQPRRIFRISLWLPCQNSLLIRISWCTFVDLCQTPRPNEKRYIGEIWYTHFTRPYLKLLFYGFSKNWPLGPLGSKSCRVKWILRISLRLPCQNLCEASRQRWYFYVYSYICIIVYLCQAPWHNENRYRPEVCHTHTFLDHI